MYIIVFESGKRRNVTNEVRVEGSYIVYNGIKFIYDEDEGVYWQNGIRFSTRIEKQ